MMPSALSRYKNTKNTFRSAGSDVAKEIKLQQLPDFCMLLGCERKDGRSCWNLLGFVSLAGDSTHFIIPLFWFMYCRLNMSPIQAGSAGEVDPEADKERDFQQKWQKALPPVP